jgi:cellulose biosynthesis protein BcsQ
MAIIALISQKGGVGKSALARLLAVEFLRAGWAVKIADLDTMQGTSTKWESPTRPRQITAGNSRRKICDRR